MRLLCSGYLPATWLMHRYQSYQWLYVIEQGETPLQAVLILDFSHVVASLCQQHTSQPELPVALRH